MKEFNISNSVYTLTPVYPEIKLIVNLNSTGYAQAGAGYSIQGVPKVQIKSGSFVVFELANNRTWIITSGEIVTPVTPAFITSVANTATVNLAVSSNQLTASFASLLISQFTNDENFIDLEDLSAVAPLVYDNTTGAFSIPEADSTTDGYLSSTDWNTFNNKQAAITPAALTRTDDTNVTVTITGTAASALLQAVNIALGWTGFLSVARGGTGQGAYAPPLILGKSTTTTTHTGDLVETVVGSLLIPANTVAVGDLITFKHKFIKTGTANTWRSRVYINTSAAAGGTEIYSGRTPNPATTVYAAGDKWVTVKSATVTEYYCMVV